MPDQTDCLRIATTRASVVMAIPTKPSSIPEARRTRFRGEVEQPSERSDPGIFIVEQVLGREETEDLLTASGAQRRKNSRSRKGIRGKGAASFPVQRVATPAEIYPAGSAPPRFFRIEPPRSSIRVALCTNRSRTPSATVGAADQNKAFPRPPLFMASRGSPLLRSIDLLSSSDIFHKTARFSTNHKHLALSELMKSLLELG